MPSRRWNTEFMMAESVFHGNILLDLKLFIEDILKYSNIGKATAHIVQDVESHTHSSIKLRNKYLLQSKKYSIV